MTKNERRLERLYASLPVIRCKGLCGHSCGVILMSPLEWRRMTASLGREPVSDGKSLTCPAFDPGSQRCTAYKSRPLVCRLYGVAKGMECPHGCQRSGLLVKEEAERLILETAAIGGRGVCSTHSPAHLAAHNSADGEGRFPLALCPTAQQHRT